MHRSHELNQAIEEYLKGRATDEQLLLVNNWYRSFNDEQAEVYINTAEQNEDVRQRIRQRIAQSLQEPASKIVAMYPARSTYKRRWGIAATAVILALAALWFLAPWANKTPRLMVIHTGVGETKEIVLPDSSTVWLNAMSNISYPEFFDHNRAVILDGEAFFDIKHQPKQPFVVHAGNTNTTVLGTAFSINSYQPDQQIVVTVMRGKVQLADAHTKSSILTPGRQLNYKTVTGQMTERESPLTESPSWMKGILEFDAAPLEEITATLSRWYNVQFEFGNDAIRHCNYTGSFSRDMQLKTVVDLFSQINNITYKINADETTVILSGKGCK